MLILQDISYSHPDKELLFQHLNLTVNNHDKIALTGNNGRGKSTLLKIIAGELPVTGGQLKIDCTPYYVPQVFGQYNHLTIAGALRVEGKLNALKEILEGKMTVTNQDILADDWTIEERCMDALRHWQLPGLDLSQKMATLSGGQKTRVFLAGILIYQPAFVLLDEPGNHLDIAGRQLLYDFIQSTQSSLIVVSHDRQLLNLFNIVCELNKEGIMVYGGNYDFYAGLKQAENSALHHTIHSKEKALQKAKEKKSETAERQQKLDFRGKKKQGKAGIARIMKNTLRNNAENSTSKLKSVHDEKVAGISQELLKLRSSLPDIDKMKFGFHNSGLHKGKILFTADNINFSYGRQPLWTENLSFQVTSGERVAIKGINGSGKTTLINLMLGTIEPHTGTVYYSAANKPFCIDQDYSLIDNKLNVYEQAQRFNKSALEEHEMKTRLHRFLFTKEDWNKPCSALSGGEKMRLILCCIAASNQSPDIIILDEPTNNLDIPNTGILTAAINEYEGTLIVVSHDNYFLKQINIERTISL